MNTIEAFRRGNAETRFTDYEIRTIRREARDRTQADIAVEFGVTRPMISKIVNREAYAWVE